MGSSWAGAAGFSADAKQKEQRAWSSRGWQGFRRWDRSECWKGSVDTLHGASESNSHILMCPVSQTYLTHRSGVNASRTERGSQAASQGTRVPALVLLLRRGVTLSKSLIKARTNLFLRGGE